MNIILGTFFLIATVILTHLLCQKAKNTLLMDNPNERSMHATPTIRGGGAVFIGLSLLSMPFLCFLNNNSFAELLVPFISISMLAAISFLDDLYNLSAKRRFLVQSCAVLLIALWMRPVHLDFIMFNLGNPVLVSCFIFVAGLWAINHFNFMDGLDGFCASQALFLFAAYALLFSFHGAVLYQNYCLVLIGCLIGFLMFNFPPAKLFMGDVGSASLGLITFTVAIIGQQKSGIPILYWFVLNGLFLFDATITLIRRVLKKEKWSSPHKKHAYQRLKQYGADTRAILLGQLFINGSILSCIMMSINGMVPLTLMLPILLSLLLVIYYLIEKRFPMFQRASHQC